MAVAPCITLEMALLWVVICRPPRGVLRRWSQHCLKALEVGQSLSLQAQSWKLLVKPPLLYIIGQFNCSCSHPNPSGEGKFVRGCIYLPLWLETYFLGSHKVVQIHRGPTWPLTLNVWGQSQLVLTRSISWLLMPWLLASPGHQQSWYWLCRIGRSLFY